MKSNLSTSTSRKIWGGLVLCLVAFLLASCENFLKSQDVKQQIEDAIAYNNAMSSTLIFRAENGEGDFLTGSEKACKLGYTIDVQFSVNANDFVFKGLEAVSSIDKTVSRAEYVEFTDIGTDHEKKNGVYKIQIKLLKQSDDILIRPVCNLIPRVKSISPAYSKDGCEQDTSITIEFNKPINPQTFDPNCISIKNGTEELFSTNPEESYFEAPQFSSDNTILTIPTVKGKYLIPLSPAGQKPKDITISIVSSGIKDTEGALLQPVESHTYKINQSVDNEKPEIKTIIAENTSDKTNFAYRALTDKAIDKWSSATEYDADGTTIKFLNGDYSRNHIIDTVHLTIQGYDKTSGIKCVKVHQVFEKTAGGGDTTKVEEENIFGIGQFIFVQNSDNVYEYSFDYKIPLAANDGVYRLDISVIDKAENESEALTYYVIKDADLKRTLDWIGYLDVKSSFLELYDEISTGNCYPKYNKNTGKYESKFSFYKFDFYEDKFYSLYKTLCQKLLIQQFNSNNEYVTIFEYDNISNSDLVQTGYNAYSETVVTQNNILTSKINKVLENLVIDPDTTTKFKVVLYEENGVINEYPFVIIKRPRIVAHEKVYASSLEYYADENDYSISSDISVSLGRGIVGKRADGESTITSFKRLSTIMADCFDSANCTYYISYSRKTKTASGSIYSAFGKSYLLYRNDGPIDFNSLGNYSNFIYVPTIDDAFDLPSFTLPDPDKIDENIANGKLVFPKNSSKVLVTIDITYPPNDDYKYHFKVSGEWNKITLVPANTNIIELPNGAERNVALIAFDSEGNIVAESTPQSITYMGPDNVPPVVNVDYSGKLWYYKDHIEIARESVYDYDPKIINEDNELDANYNGVESVDYYFVPVDLGTNVSLSELENGNYPKYTLKVPEYDDGFHADNPSMIIPVYFQDQGTFYIYCYIKDKEGNSAIFKYPRTYGSYTVPIVPEYNLKNNDYTANSESNYGQDQELELFSVTFQKYSDSIKPAGDAYNKDELWICYYIFDSNSNTWKAYRTLEKVRKTTTQDENNHIVTVSKYYRDAMTDVENKFYKIEVLYGMYSSTSGGLPVYFYPVYMFNGEDDYNYTCRNKSVMDSLNGYQVFCDKPVFAHTMFSKFKLTETNTVADSHTWEGRGAETGLVYNDASAGNFSYTDENYEDIPESCYYTTIFHFVDGTTVMTPVKQK